MERPEAMQEMKNRIGRSGDVPERVQPVGDDQVEGAEGGLVQGGKHHAEDHERQGAAVDPPDRRVQLELLQDDGGELQGQHGGVEDDAPGDLEHHRVRVPHDQGVPEVVRPAQVDHQHQHHQQVADEGGEDGRTDDGLVVMGVEQVHRGDDGEPGRGQADAQEIEADPEAPGELVGEVGGGAQAQGEPGHGGDEAGAISRAAITRQKVMRGNGNDAHLCSLSLEVAILVRPSCRLTSSRRLVIHQMPASMTPPTVTTLGTLSMALAVRRGMGVWPRWTSKPSCSNGTGLR